MTAGSNITIYIFIVTNTQFKFKTTVIVNQKNSDIIFDSSNGKRIHIIQKCQIARNHKTEIICCKTLSNQRRHATVNTKSSHVREEAYRILIIKKIPYT